MITFEFVFIEIEEENCAVLFGGERSQGANNFEARQNRNPVPSFSGFSLATNFSCRPKDKGIQTAIKGETK